MFTLYTLTISFAHLTTIVLCGKELCANSDLTLGELHCIISTVEELVMESNRLMNTEQVAELLGMKPQTLRMWTSQKKISFTKLGSLVRFTPEQVEELINKGTVRAIK